jgi:hypothetical protein
MFHTVFCQAVFHGRDRDGAETPVPRLAPIDDNGAMSWLLLLGIVAAVIAVVSVLGVRPKGGRPVDRTQLMGVARFVLIIAALIIGFLVFRARSRP